MSTKTNALDISRGHRNPCYKHGFIEQEIEQYARLV